MSKFKDIKIIDLETELHYQAQHEPLFYFFYLKLSAQPPPWWMAASTLTPMPISLQISQISAQNREEEVCSQLQVR